MDFYEEEVRCNYKISSIMKELWAIQLDMLNEFDKVCEKYNLKYFLDFGTMLGAVRHKGYIPWDDDVDVSMLREDYEKFIQVAPNEFKYPYFFQNAYTDKDIVHGFSKLRRSDTCEIIKGDLQYGYRYNQGIWIDIFVMDGLPQDEQQQKAIDARRDKFYYTLFMLVRPSKKADIKYLPKMLRYAYYNLITGGREKEFTRFNDFAQQFSGSNIVGHLMFYNSYRFRRELLEDLIRVPFENLMLPIPRGYDEYLRTVYGDSYMTPKRTTKYHGQTIFDTNRSYKDVLASL